MKGVAAYLGLYRCGELATRIERAKGILESCEICPRHCQVNRLAGEVGKCRTGARAMVSSYGPHFGEEAPLVGSHGSGTIFFTNCNLRCVFCQNYSISQLGEGREVTKEELAAMMLSLQKTGCHNINLVSPTHVVPQILEALELAIARGLSIPLVYNSGGYDSVETLRLLEGIVDIYMPDMKYSDDEIARQYSGIENYPAVNRAAVKEMHRQVGDLQIDEQGVAIRGLLVRHLVLPHGLAGTQEIVRFLAEEISLNTYLNVMAQYHPCHKACQFSLLSRSITREEFLEAVELAQQQGLERLDRLHSPAAVRVVFL
jgi:putative pyruvate formate lyase activating enzyme